MGCWWTARVSMALVAKFTGLLVTLLRWAQGFDDLA